MDANEIVAFIRKEMNPLYQDSGSYSELKIHYAFLASVPVDLLKEVYEQVTKDWKINSSVGDRIARIIAEAKDTKPVRNEPIGTLLRWYNDKNSKKVKYAFERLKERYPQQTFSTQKQILKAFLNNGTRTSADWAARRLRENWIAGFEDDVRRCWELYRTGALATCVVTNLPVEYVMKELPALEPLEEYQYLCARLGYTPGFEIDESRLDIPQLFYVKGKLGKKEAVSVMDAKVDEFILGQPPSVYAERREDPLGRPWAPDITSIWGMPLIIWGMKKVNHTEGIARLCRLQSSAGQFALRDWEFPMASFVYQLKVLVSQDLPDDSEYWRERERWGKGPLGG